jgi:hypothetical protein
VSRWKIAVSPNGNVTLTDIPQGIRFAATFVGSGDRWAFPKIQEGQPIDLSGYDGIAFDLTTSSPDPSTVVRMLFKMPSGSVYTLSVPASQGAKHVVLLFDNAQWGSFSPPDPTGHLDPSHIASVALGVNSRADDVLFDATNFQVVKLPR